MPIQIVTVGKKHEAWIVDGIERYQKRLNKPFDVKWELIPNSSFEGLAARQDESKRILSRLDANAYVILLDERGKNISSPELAEQLRSRLDQSQLVIFIIGGAYGVDDSLHQRANFVWSLSKLVFPHQLVRLLLAEQIYRAQSIVNQSHYHHE